MCPRSAMATRSVYAVLVVPVLLLNGCSGGDHLSDLAQYVADLDSKYRGHVEPLPQLKPYETFAYSAGSLRDPFQLPIHSDSRFAQIEHRF
jgi:type IV pilus assembly protein PilP